MTGAIPSLAAAYEQCRQINRRHATSYYWATRLLDRRRRPHVHALYAFARTADDLVDQLPTDGDPAQLLHDFSDQFDRAIGSGAVADPVLRAVTDTIESCSIPVDPFRRFLASMRADLTVTTYATWEDLLGYMDGSAAAIGEMMLPILRPVDSAAALAPARDLGIAFQLTNFLRDIGDDLERGRIYLPLADLERFGVSPDDVRARQVTPAFAELMRFEIERCRMLYRSADRGVDLLPRRSAICIRTARNVYAEILDRIEHQGYDVFSERASVGPRRKVALTIDAIMRSLRR